MLRFSAPQLRVPVLPGVLAAFISNRVDSGQQTPVTHAANQFERCTATACGCFHVTKRPRGSQSQQDSLCVSRRDYELASTEMMPLSFHLESSTGIISLQLHMRVGSQRAWCRDRGRQECEG